MLKNRYYVRDPQKSYSPDCDPTFLWAGWSTVHPIKTASIFLVGWQIQDMPIKHLMEKPSYYPFLSWFNPHLSPGRVYFLDVFSSSGFRRRCTSFVPIWTPEAINTVWSDHRGDWMLSLKMDSCSQVKPGCGQYFVQSRADLCYQINDKRKWVKNMHTFI